VPDIVVTVPKWFWAQWIEEGDLPGDAATGRFYDFSIPTRPKILPGQRVYIVAHGRLRGYAPLVRVETHEPPGGWVSGHRSCVLVRGAGAVAVTIPEQIRGFQGWRYSWWSRALEQPFPGWRDP
jgi:hypothetical protein